MDKKIYFVTEGIVDSETIHSERFNQIINPDTEETIFDDVFQITECKVFEEYKDKENFLEAVLGIAESYFADFGEDIFKITLIAINQETDTFLWGVSMDNFDENSFKYTTLDFKESGYTFKFEDDCTHDTSMKIINKVTDETYIQWIESFVKEVITRANISCNEVIIEDIEHSKHISLTIDGEEYDIRTWNFRPVKKDKNGETCAEMIEYTLFKMIKDNSGSHGEEVSEGRIKIEWEN